MRSTFGCLEKRRVDMKFFITEEFSSWNYFCLKNIQWLHQRTNQVVDFESSSSEQFVKIRR
ncbi:hypothetical protein RchiOBHm_Chr2g0153361 [Rosa chinensis]|uniref:Uncharacterized protein n=1 Tax=Rosa chinensis TaxID=74649 RepID=A0A2P6S0N1_ROSCH|nr:hypothetical protein RchiOBHm_Chr2g0153361 [Rosa chinensis]